MELFIIDAIGPFFRSKRNKIHNWSKIPFDDLERNRLDKKSLKAIVRDFTLFIDRVTGLGYNAISIDDLAHLVVFDFYPDDLKIKIQRYQKLFGKLFKIARQAECKIFVNTDVMFFNKEIEAFTGNDHRRIARLLKDACLDLFDNIEIDGIIFRIGESDGVDVKGDFKSRLILKTAAKVNRLIKELLPAFEDGEKLLIFRTWTVGIYPIGDLMWNERTFDEAFKSISSPNFILSMKYGDTDFFDQLDFNPLFFHSSHKKIIELQARREREGFGVFPFYTGWQYEKYYKAVKNLENVIGISVWCQTGGWSYWRNITYLSNSSPWTELNVESTIGIFRHGLSAAESLARTLNKKQMVFLKKFHALFDKLLYIDGFADKSYYFRRLRIPPLLWVYWDHVTVNPLMAALCQFAGQKKFKIPQNELRSLYKFGKKIKIENIEFLCDSLKILAICRRSLWKKSFKPGFVKQIDAYQRKYPHGFQFSIHQNLMSYSHLSILFKILLREQPAYRLIDRIMMTRTVSTLLRFLLAFYQKDLPKFVNKQAMSMDHLLK